MEQQSTKQALQQELEALQPTQVKTFEPEPDTDIADDDPAVLHLMRNVANEEWLQYWPELANRSLAEAKQIVRLQRIAADKTNTIQDRQEAVQNITVIRKRLRGDRV